MMAALMGANMLLNQTLRNNQNKRYMAQGNGQWVNVNERLPEQGKLVYTRSPSGLIGAYTLYDHGWNSWVSTDNEPIAEWFESNK